MCTDFAAHGRRGLSSREKHWIAPVLLAAVQRSPWLRPATCRLRGRRQDSRSARLVLQKAKATVQERHTTPHSRKLNTSRQGGIPTAGGYPV
jgi:hypothetical protein